MKKVTFALALSAAAGFASADIAGTGPSNFDNVEVITSLNTLDRGYLSADQMGGPQSRTPVAGASYNGSAAWGNGAGGFAPVVVDGGGAAVSNNDVFDGNAQAYAGGAATQLGDTWSSVEFSGTLMSGNDFVQVNYFSNTGSALDAAGAGFPVLGMAAGVGFFTSEVQDSINVGPGASLVSAIFGFFDAGGNFLGAADISANDFSDASGLGAIGVIDMVGSGLAGNATEMFIQIEYIPTPSSVALLGLGGLVAARRRR